MTKRAIWFAIAGATIIAVTMLVKTEPGRVTMRILTDTNSYRTIVVSNGTRYAHWVSPYGEILSNGVWLFATNALIAGSYQALGPRDSITYWMFMPTQGPQRVTVSCIPVSAWAWWIGSFSERARKYELHLELGDLKDSSSVP